MFVSYQRKIPFCKSAYKLYIIVAATSPHRYRKVIAPNRIQSSVTKKPIFIYAKSRVLSKVTLPLIRNSAVAMWQVFKKARLRTPRVTHNSGNILARYNFIVRTPSEERPALAAVSVPGLGLVCTKTRDVLFRHASCSEFPTLLFKRRPVG